VIEKYNYGGNENTGFHAVLTDSYALVPPEFKKKDFLGQETVETKIAKTNLVGLFSAGNSNAVLVPQEASQREIEKLEDSGINYKVIESNFNALGNLILANDSGAIISPKLEKYKASIEEALEVNVEVGTIAGLNPGVSAVANSKGAVLHREASESDAEEVKEVLELEDVDLGSVNMGSPFIGSGAVVNDSDLLTGENTTGPEISRFDRTLFQT
jgi:translation initiation factor 6